MGISNRQLKYFIISTGSQGNAVIIEDAILIDVGVSYKQIEPYMDKIKLDASASYHHVCFDRLQRYKVIKQADVLLLMSRMPHLFTDKQKKEAWEDFEPICLHDSTLSFASHALFALQNGFDEQGFEYLRKALLLDLRDVMGNTGHEGLHLACMGEAWQAVFALSSSRK